ncbi:MAG: penicillin-binding transpeptidase domain-containing protein [Blautia sp.]
MDYPGYDNNRLANHMDQDYFEKLNTDLTSPIFNKATQQRTAPGSTFKLVSAIAGVEDNLIDDGTVINCKGSFDLIQPPINCWQKSGHGGLDLTSAIEQSCNVFFTTIGFMAGENKDGDFSETTSLKTLKTYASMLDLDKKTGIEITESEPQISDQYAVPSYIGQERTCIPLVNWPDMLRPWQTKGQVLNCLCWTRPRTPRVTC